MCVCVSVCGVCVCVCKTFSTKSDLNRPLIALLQKQIWMNEAEKKKMRLQDWRREQKERKTAAKNKTKKQWRQQQQILNAQKNESKNSVFPSLQFFLNYLSAVEEKSLSSFSVSHSLLQAHAHNIHTSLYVYLCVTNDTLSKFSCFCRLNKIAGK